MEKTAKKIFTNNVNPHGTGVVRFMMAELLFKTKLPMTVTELATELSKTYPGVQSKWVRRVLQEIHITGVQGLPLQSIEKRVRHTKCQAYYIQTPTPKSKQNV